MATQKQLEALKLGRGHKQSPEARKKISEVQKGKKINEKQLAALLANRRTGGKMSIETRHKMSIAKKGVLKPNYRGSKNPRWTGGQYKTDLEKRRSPEYKRWQLSVYKRDEYKCQSCNKTGLVLNAHHIIPWAMNKEKRYLIENGITLCTNCHKKIHKSNNKQIYNDIS